MMVMSCVLFLCPARHLLVSTRTPFPWTTDNLWTSQHGLLVAPNPLLIHNLHLPQIIDFTFSQTSSGLFHYSFTYAPCGTHAERIYQSLTGFWIDFWPLLLLWHTEWGGIKVNISVVDGECMRYRSAAHPSTVLSDVNYTAIHSGIRLSI